MTAELPEEAVRMRRAAGVVFVDGPAGRRAVVAGTGLDVWEVISTWRENGQNDAGLRRSYPWLTEPQICSALWYYEIYPKEIEARLDQEAQWTPERVRRELPFAQPRRC